VGCPSFQEGLIIVSVLVLIFGSTRLPQLGEALGRSFRNFKRGVTGQDEIDVTDRSQVGPGDDGEGPTEQKQSRNEDESERV
jgi:sec-independent protein translocase protein TatA